MEVRDGKLERVDPSYVSTTPDALPTRIARFPAWFQAMNLIVADVVYSPLVLKAVVPVASYLSMEPLDPPISAY